MLGKQASWQSEADYSQCQVEGETAGLFDPTDKWVKLDRPADRQLFEALVQQLDPIEEGSIDPYSNPDWLQQWTLCIGNIMRQAEEPLPPGDLWCPIIFDGWRCWPATRASETAYVSCPGNQPGFSADLRAHKNCTSNGTWFRRPDNNRYWSNYTTCVDHADLAFRAKILNLHVIGNLISLLALAVSLIIFISFKSLKCTRVTIHKNLFLSFIVNNLMWILWYKYVLSNAELLKSNPLICQLWHIVLHYFLVANYFWMFCEGLYLHTVLVVAFVSMEKILKWFYMLGWLTPLPITLAYAYYRHQDKLYSNYCWIDESPYDLILQVPSSISLLLNLVFLINIVRVLVTKLRAINNTSETHQTRKAVRATLILIPLLGLHYMLTPFKPEAKSEWEPIHSSLVALSTSFQGLCVALLFCFCNGEVQTVIRKKLKDSFCLNQLTSSNGPTRWQQPRSKQQPPPLAKHLDSAAYFNPETRLRPRSNTSTSFVSLAGQVQSRERRKRQRSVISLASGANELAANLISGVTKLACFGRLRRTATTNSTANSNNSNSSSLLTTLAGSPPNPLDNNQSQAEHSMLMLEPELQQQQQQQQQQHQPQQPPPSQPANQPFK